MRMQMANLFHAYLCKRNIYLLSLTDARCSRNSAKNENRRVRIYNNWSQRNELIEEDEGKKNVLIVMDDAVFHPQEPDVCAGLWC